MKVPSLDIQEKLIQASANRSGPVGRELAPPATAFATFLGNAVKQETGETTAPLDKEKVAVQVELIRYRMNQSIIDAFADKEEEETAAAESGFLSFAPEFQELLAGQAHPRNPKTSDKSFTNVKDLDAIIHKASETYGVDKDLIIAVIRAESGFDAGVTSPKQAMGLMQLMPETARDLGVTDAYDPEQNIMAGTRYLRGLLDRYNGDVRSALAAYNWGMGNLEKNIGLPTETRNYISKIMKDYGRDKA